MDDHKTLGNTYYRAGEYRKAIQVYTMAIAASPPDSRLYGNRAAAYYMLGQYDKALEDCQNALQLDPTYIKCQVRSGKL